MRIRRVSYNLGNVIERQEYLDGRYGAPGEKRAKKKKATPEEVEQVNQWTRERKARHRLRMYFKVNDYFFTLTYPKEERPSDMKQAKQDFKEFYLFCKKEYKKRGQELRWIRNIECTPSGNWHIHVVLNRIQDTDLIIAAAWKHGKVRNKQLLYEKGEFRKLAQYVTKNEKTQKKYVDEGVLDHEIAEANFSTSRNMPLPEPKTKILYRWLKEPKPLKGYYIVKDSFYEGINKATGFPYRHYEMIRIRREDEDRTIHRGKLPGTNRKKRKVHRSGRMRD